MRPMQLVRYPLLVFHKALPITTIKREILKSSVGNGYPALCTKLAACHKSSGKFSTYHGCGKTFTYWETCIEICQSHMNSWKV